MSAGLISAGISSTVTMPAPRSSRVRALIVRADCDGPIAAVPNVLEHRVGVDQLDGGVGERDQFGLARREADAVLPARPVVDAAAGEEHDETGRGTPLGPVGVCTRP
eukprot:4427634-Prymnesium_polylepis.4